MRLSHVPFILAALAVASTATAHSWQLATVVGTIVAIMAAMTWGFTVVMLGALATYAAGVLTLTAFLSRRRAA